MRERDIHGESASSKFTTQSPFHRKLFRMGTSKKIKGERGRHRIKNWDFTVASGISLGVILQVCPEFLKPPFFFLLLAIKLYIPTTFKHVVSAGCRTDGAVFRLAVLGSEHAPFEEVRCR